MNNPMNIFISFRYHEALTEAKLLKTSLDLIGITSFVCEVPPGVNIKKEIVKAITGCDLVVILGTRTYGEPTTSSFSSYDEMEYVVEYKRPYFLIKMCEKFEIDHTRFNFRESVSYVKWTPGKHVPITVVPEIKRRYIEEVERKNIELQSLENGVLSGQLVRETSTVKDSSSLRESDSKDVWLQRAFEYLSAEPHHTTGSLISQLASNTDRRFLPKDVKITAILRSDPRFNVPSGQKIGCERVYLSPPAPLISSLNKSDNSSSLNTSKINHRLSPKSIDLDLLASTRPREMSAASLSPSRRSTEDTRIDRAINVELNNDCELFVAGLEASANEESVKVFFNEFSSGEGKIKRVTVKSSKTGGLPYAFVVFGNTEAASKCVGRFQCSLGKITVKINDKERPPHAAPTNEMIAVESDPEENSEQSNVSPKSVTNAKIIQVNDVSALDIACRYLRKTMTERQTSLAIDMHGIQLGKSGKISTVQLSSGNPHDPVFIVDAVSLKKIAFKEKSPLRILLEDDTVPKLFFDARGDVNALWHQFRIKIQNVQDLQLFDIVVRRKALYSSLTDVIFHNKAIASSQRSRVKAVRNQAEQLYAQKHGGNYSVWMERPLSPILLEFAADVRFYNLIRSSFLEFTPAAASALQRATIRRLEHARGDEFSVTDDSNVKTEPLFLEELDKNTVLPMQEVSVTSPDVDSGLPVHDCEVCQRTFPVTRLLFCNSDGPLAVKHALCEECLDGYAKDQMADQRIGDGVLRCTNDRDIMKSGLRCSAKPWTIDQLSNALSRETMALLLTAANTAVRISQEIIEQQRKDAKHARMDKIDREADEMARLLAEAGRSDKRTDKLQIIRNRLIEEVMYIRCSRCRTPFLEYDGCAALKCEKIGCRADFCALCLEDFDNYDDAHAHVIQMHGKLFISSEEFHRSHRNRRLHLLQQQFNNLTGQDIDILFKQDLLKAMCEDLRGVGLKVDDIKISLLPNTLSSTSSRKPLNSVTTAPAVEASHQDNNQLTDCLNGSACSLFPFCPYRHKPGIYPAYCSDWVVSRDSGSSYCERGPACPYAHPYYKAIVLTDCPSCPPGAKARGTPCAYTGGLPSMLRHGNSLTPLPQRLVCRDFSPPPKSRICPRALACPHAHLMTV